MENENEIIIDATDAGMTPIDIPAPSEEMAKEEVPPVAETETQKETTTVVDETTVEEGEKAEEEKVEETPAEEEKTEETEDKTEEEAVKEKVDEVVDEVTDEVDELSKVKAELEELKIIREEEKEVRAIEQQIEDNKRQAADIGERIAGNLLKELQALGIDINKSLDDIRKEDPEKAFKARQLIEQANNIQASFEAQQQEALNTRLREFVFNKAARLLEAYHLTQEEGNIAVEGLIHIFTETGLKDVDEDLRAKVELAVGRAKLLVPKVQKVVEDIKDIGSEAADIVKDVLEPKPEENPDVPAIEPETVEEKVEPKIDVEAFEEGAAPTSDGLAGGGSKDIFVDVLAELQKIKDSRERVAFYKEHEKEIEEALRKKRG